MDSEGNQSRNKSRSTFSLVSDIDVEKSGFLCRVKIPYQQF